MKIEAITLRELNIPLVHFFETSFGRTYARRILLVTVHSDGLDGWGECVAGEGPFYSEEYIDGAWDVTRRYLGPALLGKTLQSGREVPALLAQVREHRMAKAALENAVWDAEAQEKAVPLWKLLGGTQREIACGVSIGIQDSHEQLLQKIETELAAGYQRIKVKVKPGWDVEVLEKIRARWPDILLSCDANSAYTLADTEHLKSFDRFKLLMIEQPLWSDDFYFHARLQKRTANGALPRRSHSQRPRRRGRAGAGRVPHRQHQGRPRWRLLRGHRRARCRAAIRRPCVVRRHAGIGRRPLPQCGTFDFAQFQAARRRLGVQALLEGRHHRAGGRGLAAGDDHHQRQARTRLRGARGLESSGSQCERKY